MMQDIYIYIYICFLKAEHFFIKFLHHAELVWPLMKPKITVLQLLLPTLKKFFSLLIV